MIYPSRAAILAAAAGAPVALLVAVLVPGSWYAGLSWPAAVLLLALADAAYGPGPRAGTLGLALPRLAYVGAELEAPAEVRVAGLPPPARAELALALDPLLDAPDDGRATVALAGGEGRATLPLIARRRGRARIGRAWLRWRGPLGLVWKQRQLELDATLPILPDIRPVHDRSRLIDRVGLTGLMIQARRGEGAEFESLVEYRPGMDRRAIDWRQSARHLKLHAKEYRTERNDQIVFAIDCGRQMSEPVAGVPRVDRMVSAMLLGAWAALKLGDRVALHAFDSRPRIASGAVTGTRAFALLQQLAAAIDYGADESNYTLALTTLAARLDRRSLIILFTEFTDLTSAEFMIRAVRGLVVRHLLLIVVLDDVELDAALAAAPGTTEDVTRAGDRRGAAARAAAGADAAAPSRRARDRKPARPGQ